MSTCRKTVLLLVVAAVCLSAVLWAMLPEPWSALRWAVLRPVRWATHLARRPQPQIVVSSPPVRLSDVEAARSEAVRVAIQAAREGAMVAAARRMGADTQLEAKVRLCLERTAAYSYEGTRRMVDRAPARHVSAAEWEQTVRISCSFVRPDKYRVCVSAADGAEWPQDFHSHSLTANGDASISWVAVAREDADMTALPHVCREDATDADVLYWLKRVTDGPMEVRPEPTIFPAENGADDTPSEGFSGRLTSGNGRIRVDVDPDGFPKRVVVTSCHPGCEVLEIEVTSYELNPDFPPGTFAVGKEDGRPGNLAL